MVEGLRIASIITSMNDIQKFTFYTALLVLYLNVFDGRYILVSLKDQKSFSINVEFEGKNFKN